MREQVKHLSKKVGVYCIINKVNSKMYIGSSRDILSRIKHHENDLRINKHCNKHLQSAYNKYGESSFEVKVLKFCSEKNLIKQEQIFMNKYQTTSPGCGYNLAIRADGKKHSQEIKKKISDANKGQKPTEFCLQRGKEWRENYVMSEETKQKIGRESKKRWEKWKQDEDFMERRSNKIKENLKRVDFSKRSEGQMEYIKS
ncbi:MAG: GIY-YIG nuclease family protein, partial [Candidatus Paceibacterota bacterium]